jgi:phage shock protein PspC (stress-responsive transcriptional regulator)
MQSFQLERGSRKFLGVCAGLAARFGVDPLLIRVSFIVSVLLGFGFPILLYFALALIAD